MGKMDIKVRTEMRYEDSCIKYVIVYTNDIIVQGQLLYCLVSRVNILLQMKVQRVTHTSPTQALIVDSITKSFMSLVFNFIHVDNFWENLNKILPHSKF